MPAGRPIVYKIDKRTETKILKLVEKGFGPTKIINETGAPKAAVLRILRAAA